MEKLDENWFYGIWRFWWNIFLTMYREIGWDWFLTFQTISNLLVHRLHIEPSEAGFFLCLNTLRTASQKVEHLRGRNIFICFNYFYLFLCFSESWVPAKKKYFTFARKKRKKWNKKYIPIFSMQTSSALLLSMLNLLVNWSSSCSWSNDSCTNIKLLLPMYH